MRVFVGVTDKDWYGLLASRPGIEEVNFWQPSGSSQFRALSGFSAGPLGSVFAEALQAAGLPE